MPTFIVASLSVSIHLGPSAMISQGLHGQPGRLHGRPLLRPSAPNAGAQARLKAGLGRRKARCLAVRFLTPPVEHRACDFHRTTRNTFGQSPWLSMKRLFPFPQLHSAFPVDSLRVRWVPLVPSFQRLGAFALSPHPGVRGFPTLGLLTNGVSR